MSDRVYFTLPNYENDFTMSGFRPPQRKVSDKPTHIAQMEEPWSRLSGRHTVASSYHTVMCEHQTQPLNDSLDFQLKTIYNHFNNTFWKKNQILLQKETLAQDSRQQEDQSKQHRTQEGIRVWVDPKRNSIHSIK